MERSNEMGEKRRSVVYVMAAVYLLYMAYKIFGTRLDNGGENNILMLIFCAVFAIAGVVLLVFSFMIFIKNRSINREQNKEECSLDDRENTLDDRRE